MQFNYRFLCVVVTYLLLKSHSLVGQCDFLLTLNEDGTTFTYISHDLADTLIIHPENIYLESPGINGSDVVFLEEGSEVHRVSQYHIPYSFEVEYVSQGELNTAILRRNGSRHNNENYGLHFSRWRYSNLFTAYDISGYGIIRFEDILHLPSDPELTIRSITSGGARCYENDLYTCNDGLDNDGDGLIDGCDPDCANLITIVNQP